MKHYDYMEWLLYKRALVNERLRQDMEEHLYLCDECLETFLSLIEEEEVQKAGRLLPQNFSCQLIKDIEKLVPMKKVLENKDKARLANDFFLYYAAVASVAIILTATGIFGKMVDRGADIGKSITWQEKDFQTGRIYDFSQSISNRTSNFVNNFGLENKRKGD